MFHMLYTCEACRFRIVFFRQSRSARENVLMMRRFVRIRSKFQWHNSDVLCCTILGVQSDNGGVMLPKFYIDLNQVFHHKHALSVTLR
jgi:hypothetical protein